MDSIVEFLPINPSGNSMFFPGCWQPANWMVQGWSLRTGWEEMILMSASWLDLEEEEGEERPAGAQWFQEEGSCSLTSLN